MRTILISLALVALSTTACLAQENENIIKLGIIGLDTSHVIAFTDYINNPANNTGCRITAAYKGGSADVEPSYTRIDRFTKEVTTKYNVKLVDSIEQLCEQVDGILLESVDGRPHLEQIKPVIAAGLPVFVDKPAAGNLADVIALYQLAAENNVPCWSSSALRFSNITQAAADPNIGQILGCSTFGPCKLEPHHPDLYWYGIHSVEILYTIMGPGCETVQRTQTDNGEFVVGTWKDGRIGSFRGLRSGKQDYGALIFGSKKILPAAGYTGYDDLVKEIVSFFKTGIAPVSAEETIELYAFMTAADISKQKNGAKVSIAETIENAKKQK